MSTEVYSRITADPKTGWDCLNGSVDGIAFHAISTLRDGRHVGSVVTGNGRGKTAVSYPISLGHSVAVCTEAEMVELLRYLRLEE